MVKALGRLEEKENANEGWGFLKIKEMGETEACRRAKGHPLVELLEEAGEAGRTVERGEYER